MLIEFAIVALSLYLIIAAVFTFGHALFIAESLQHTTNTFAHELARTPLPPTDTLAQALQEQTVITNLFDPNSLQIDVTDWVDGTVSSADLTAGGFPITLDGYLQFKSVPMINRLLAPLMIMDLRSDGHTYLWYPGATQWTNSDGSITWVVYILNPTNVNLAPTTVPVIEAASDPDTFALGTVPVTGLTGLAGVRINYPYQSAFLSAYTYSINNGGTQVSSPIGQTDVLNTPVLAVDEFPDFGVTRGGLYAGPEHLGQQYVGTNLVRPFQRLISAQAVFRREVYP